MSKSLEPKVAHQNWAWESMLVNLRFGKFDGRGGKGDVVTLLGFIPSELKLHPNEQNCIRSNDSYEYMNGK